MKKEIGTEGNEIKTLPAKRQSGEITPQNYAKEQWFKTTIHLKKQWK